MAVVKKKKLKVKNIVIFLILIFGITLLSFILYYFVINTNIKNIYINGNTYVKDIEIMRRANIVDYPKMLDISTSNMENEIKKIDIIKDVNIKKGLFGKLTINIEEYKPLFYNGNTQKIILSNNKEIENNITVSLPILNMEGLSDKILNKLILKFSEVNDEIKLRISEIKYAPNNVDNERFLCIMNDGNYVYITLVKIEEINYYLKILPTLENKKGVLNLDYGNNFEILE